MLAQSGGLGAGQHFLVAIGDANNVVDDPCKALYIVSIRDEDFGS